MNKRDEVRLISIGFFLAATLLMVCTGHAVPAAPESVKRVMSWDVPVLSQAPKIHPTAESPVKGMGGGREE